MWNYVDSSNPTQKWNSLFGAAKLVKTADIEKYKYSGYGIGFDTKGIFSYPTGGFGKNVIFLEQIWALLYMLVIRKKNFNSCWRSYTRIGWYKINYRKNVFNQFYLA